MDGKNEMEPGTPIAVRTFQVRSISDMLRKLDWEIEQLQRSHISQASDALMTSSYFAINACVTTFHLCDWIWHQGSHAQRIAWGQGTDKAAQMRFQLFLRGACPQFETCREIANSFKHLADVRHTNKAIRSAPTWYTTMAATVGFSRAGDALSVQAGVLMVADGLETLPAAHILSVAYGFLNDFCEAHGLLDS
jgi:hypothetical protein